MLKEMYCLLIVNQTLFYTVFTEANYSRKMIQEDFQQDEEKYPPQKIWKDNRLFKMLQFVKFTFGDRY